MALVVFVYSKLYTRTAVLLWASGHLVQLEAEIEVNGSETLKSEEGCFGAGHGAVAKGIDARNGRSANDCTLMKLVGSVFFSCPNNSN